MQKPAHPQHHPALRILVVEDEDSARIATRQYLENCGHEVVAAGTAGEAFLKADKLRPDILVCDWKLSEHRNTTDAEADGIDVARELQDKYGVAVIFVTAYALHELKRNISDLDSVDCLRKPISLRTLAAIVESVSASTVTH